MSNELGNLNKESLGFSIDPEIGQKVQELHDATVLYAINLDKRELIVPIKDRENELDACAESVKLSPKANEIILEYMRGMGTTIDESTGETWRDKKYNMNPFYLAAATTRVLKHFQSLRLNSKKNLLKEAA